MPEKDGFSETIKNDILPALERMIVKERDHLTMLKNSKSPAAADFIPGSRSFLSHLELRLKQYKSYIQHEGV